MSHALLFYVQQFFFTHDQVGIASSQDLQHSGGKSPPPHTPLKQKCGHVLLPLIATTGYRGRYATHGCGTTAYQVHICEAE